jgi:hypothetical protein
VDTENDPGDDEHRGYGCRHSKRAMPIAARAALIVEDRARACAGRKACSPRLRVIGQQPLDVESHR